MNSRFVDVSDRLDEVFDAYESLEVLLCTADSEHYKLNRLLKVLNKELRASLDELEEIRVGKAKLKSVDQVSTI